MNSSEKSRVNKTIALNRKARFNYFIQERFEAGIRLVGTEVKSVREGKVNLQESYVRIMRGEAFLINCHITAYSRMQGHTDYNPRSSRKLLLKRKDLDRLAGLSEQKGFAIFPLSVYLKRGLVKVEIGVGKGKKEYDKRETIKRRIHDRESAAAIKKHTR